MMCGATVRSCSELPSLPLMGRVADSLLSAGWGGRVAKKFPPTRHASRLGFAEIGACLPPHVGGGMEQAAPLLNSIGATDG
jgi:hypothetical protein